MGRRGGLIAVVLLFASIGLGGIELATASGSTIPAASCPDHDLGGGAPASNTLHPASVRSTVPGRPTKALLCRYWGFNRGRQSHTLARRRLLDRRTTSRMAREMDRIPVPEVPEEPTFTTCFFDNDARVYAYFFYPHEPRVVVELHLRGCAAVGNGRAPDKPLPTHLARLIDYLVPLPRSGRR